MAFKPRFAIDPMAKKDTREAALRRGLEELGKSGFDAATVSPSAVESLARRLGADPAVDLAVAFLLGRIADPAAAEALIKIEAAAPAKDLKREARRSLFKLEQRGLTVTRAEDASAGKRSAAAPISEIEGYLSIIDGAGDRLVWLVRPHAGGGLQLLQGVVSDRSGLLQADGGVVKRKDLRAQAAEIQKNASLPMAPVPWEYADGILYNAYDKAKGAGQKTGQFASLRAAFNATKPREVEHPVYGRLPKDSAQTEDWRSRSRRLLEEPAFHFWLVDEDWMKPYLDRIEQAQESRLVLNDAQKEERLAAIVRDAAREIFAGESGAVFRRRLEDVSWCLEEAGRREPALLALAVALQLAEGDIGMLDIAFLTGLVQKSIAYYLAQAKQKAKEEPSLIVKP
ncbi:MAG TPA: hypothetical protein VGH16_20920 [Candidatus Binatia bacterium]